MANITASDVAKLRSLTGAGMMDCKKALEEANGDMDAAADILRKKGILKAAKREEKVASEGLVYGITTGKAGSLIEVNCETDFVAKSEDFVSFTKSAAQAVLDGNPSAEQFDSAKLASDQTVSQALEAMALKLGEKIRVRRFVRFESDGIVSIYLHGSKIGAMVELSGGDNELGVELAMHIAASNPKYLNRAEVPTEVLDKEKEIYAEQLRQQGKPANIVENIVRGKMDKFFGEVCLLEQPFIRDEEKKIEKLIAEKGAQIKRFARYELGEGLQKKECDFAAEVAQQLG